MGFIGRMDVTATQIRRELGARDFIWLAALGTAARGPAGLEDVCHAIDAITLGQWLPVGDLVTASVAEMVRGGHLQVAAAAPERLRLTARGRETLALLLAQPIGRPSSVFGQVGLRLKLAFLDLAPPSARRQHLDTLIELYEDELSRRLSTHDGCAALGGFGEEWRRHDIGRIQGDIAILRGMAATSATP